MSLKEYVRSVDLAKLESKWTDEETAQKAKESLHGNAYVWFEAHGENESMARSWAKLKENLIEAFRPELIQAKRSIYSALNQGHNEPVERYMRRVRNEVDFMTRNDPVSCRTFSEYQVQRVTNDMWVQRFFVSGLSCPVMKEYIAEREPFERSADLLKVAVEAEKNESQIATDMVYNSTAAIKNTAESSSMMAPTDLSETAVISYVSIDELKFD